MKKCPLEVSTGVLLRSDGSFLLTQRLSDKLYGGFWEFPGGKLEIGELPDAALRRELYEEIGIHVLEMGLWKTMDYQYPEIIVRLHVFRIIAWDAEPLSCEGQLLSWQSFPATVSPILPATLNLISEIFA